jgi:ubiquinone/menaquinone biosynthesis C-methylase UbiE
MSSAKQSYILESQAESERLDRQSRAKAFDFRDELAPIDVREGQTILDAGCGSGIVTDYLSRLAPGVKVTGWDFSQDRVDAANAKYGASENVRFVRRNLLDPDTTLDVDAFSGSRFDTIVCRYVLRHFKNADAKKVVRKLFDALKPGGTLYCIDVEGVLGDVYPASQFLRDALSRLRSTEVVDFQVARKMPSMLLEQGFEAVDWRVLVSEFRGQDLSDEIENLKQSVKNAEPLALSILGGPESLARFSAEYFAALRGPACTLFYNRLIAKGTRPRAPLKKVGVTSGND